MQIAVLNQNKACVVDAQKFAQNNTLKYVEILQSNHNCERVLMQIANEYDYLIRFTESGICLMDCTNEKPIEIMVDFVGGANAHRRRFGGGKGQAISKAVGLNKNNKLIVLDATAGFGADAFVLAGLGCHVTMIDRSPVVQLLLSDGLQRAFNYARENDQELLKILSRIEFVESDSIVFLRSIPPDAMWFDIIYLDPMFPTSEKSAKVKKTMHAFHNLIGLDSDADQLLPLALTRARYRVVVKRPRLAPFLADKAPSMQFVGKSSRFDVYTIKKIDQ